MINNFFQCLNIWTTHTPDLLICRLTRNHIAKGLIKQQGCWIWPIYLLSLHSHLVHRCVLYISYTQHHLVYVFILFYSTCFHALCIMYIAKLLNRFSVLVMKLSSLSPYLCHSCGAICGQVVNMSY